MVFPQVARITLTDDGLPFSVGLCDLIGATHLAERHATDDEDNDTWPGAILSRGLILVPVAVSSTARKRVVLTSKKLNISNHLAPNTDEKMMI